MLDQIAERNQAGALARKAGVPEVGIFWVFNGKLIYDGLPWTQAEGYADFRNYAASHEEHWTVLQRHDIVPRDVEYDEPPRGRIVYRSKERKFYLYADRCILKSKATTDRIISEAKLPRENTVVGSDSHYRCAKCLRREA